MNRTNTANPYLCVSNPAEINGDTSMDSITITDQIKAMCQNPKYGPDSYDVLSNNSCEVLNSFKFHWLSDGTNSLLDWAPYNQTQSYMTGVLTLAPSH